jgi:hypothetical protein
MAGGFHLCTLRCGESVARARSVLDVSQSSLTTLGLYAQSVNSSMVEAQESMLKAILRNGSNAVN